MTSILDPHGPAARSIAELWWILFAVSVVIYAIVMTALAYALLHSRKGGERDAPASTVAASDRRALRWIVLGGMVIPAVVLTTLFVFVLASLRELTAERPPDLVIEVIGHQWWWEVHYQSAGGNGAVETANEIHIPVGRRIKLLLRSDNVIHSFWVPALQGKMDLVPGHPNNLWIEADTAGVYRGQCAEYCGLQHANMVFHVVAQPPSEFAAWLAHQRRPAVRPRTALARRGFQVFLDAACARCHTIRGTSARGVLGPDLTHFASRLTLAAGTVPNTEGHLAGWIANPQNIKPGSKMPYVPLVPEAFGSLLAYLATLR